MQKVINLLAILSFVGVAGIYAGGSYLYIQREEIIKNAKESATKAATEAVMNAIPDLLDAAMPEIPEVTGGALPIPPSSNVTAPTLSF